MLNNIKTNVHIKHSILVFTVIMVEGEINMFKVLYPMWIL